MQGNETPIFSGLLIKHHDKVLADDSLSDCDVVLISLYLLENESSKTGILYDDLKNRFVSLGRKEDYFRQNLFSAKKQNLIIAKENTLLFTIKGLKSVWKILGKAEKTPVRIIKSGEHFTAIKLFEEFINQIVDGEEIWLSDPYISPNTLFPFTVLKNKIKSIKILTSNIHEEEKFKEYKKKFEKEMDIIVEVKTSKKTHDRYLISNNNCWAIGGSIKDLGNKDTTIYEMTMIIESIKDLFNVRWEEAEKYEGFA